MTPFVRLLTFALVALAPLTRVAGEDASQDRANLAFTDLARVAGVQVTVEVAGQALSAEEDSLWVEVAREWEGESSIELDLPMPVQEVVCDQRVEDNRGKIALERGPLVYCFEEADNGPGIPDLEIPTDEDWVEQWEPDLLGGVVTLKAGEMTAVPYYAWGHRGVGEMAVWLRAEGV